MKKSQKQALEIGAGVAALAAIAGGVYMMTGKNAKNRKKVAKWVGNLQDDVVKELKDAGKVTKAVYNKAIDTATKNYKGLKNVSTVELAAVAAELKSSWDRINAEMSNVGNTVRRAVPKRATKAVKKVSKAVKKAAPKKKVAKKR